MKYIIFFSLLISAIHTIHGQGVGGPGSQFRRTQTGGQENPKTQATHDSPQGLLPADRP